jgi:predicted nucleic acid-binding protein
VLYLDSSALVKLVVDETETEALRAFASGQRLLSSEIALVEVPRAARRYELEARGAQLVEQLALIEIDEAILAGAAEVDPVTLSSLDAVHLASGQFARDRIDYFVAYDAQLAAAAAAAGLEVAAPR